MKIDIFVSFFIVGHSMFPCWTKLNTYMCSGTRIKYWRKSETVHYTGNNDYYNSYATMFSWRQNCGNIQWNMNNSVRKKMERTIISDAFANVPLNAIEISYPWKLISFIQPIWNVKCNLHLAFLYMPYRLSYVFPNILNIIIAEIIKKL